MNTKKYCRRRFIKNAIQVGSSALLFSQTLPIIAESESLNYEEILFMNTQTVEEITKQYVQSWNEKGLKNMKESLDKCWTADSTYADPNNAPFKGFDALIALIVRAQEQAPGGIYSQTSPPEFHHGSGRFNWRLTKKDGSKRNGMDYFEYDSENRITRIVGFFDVVS